MAVQFSLSYDANGDPVLVENTVTGTRQVISRSTVVSPYKARFEAPASGDPVTDAEENQTDSNQSAIMDYIMEMEKGADDDQNKNKRTSEGPTLKALMLKQGDYLALSNNDRRREISKLINEKYNFDKKRVKVATGTMGTPGQKVTIIHRFKDGGIAGERKVFDFGDPTEFKLLMEYLNKLDKIYNK